MFVDDMSNMWIEDLPEEHFWDDCGGWRCASSDNWKLGWRSGRWDADAEAELREVQEQRALGFKESDCPDGLMQEKKIKNYQI